MKEYERKTTKNKEESNYASTLKEHWHFLVPSMPSSATFDQRMASGSWMDLYDTDEDDTMENRLKKGRLQNDCLDAEAHGFAGTSLNRSEGIKRLKQGTSQRSSTPETEEYQAHKKSKKETSPVVEFIEVREVDDDEASLHRGSDQNCSREGELLKNEGTGDVRNLPVLPRGGPS